VPELAICDTHPDHERLRLIDAQADAGRAGGHGDVAQRLWIRELGRGPAQERRDEQSDGPTHRDPRLSRLVDDRPAALLRRLDARARPEPPSQPRPALTIGPPWRTSALSYQALHPGGPRIRERRARNGARLGRLACAILAAAHHRPAADRERDQQQAAERCARECHPGAQDRPRRPWCPVRGAGSRRKGAPYRVG
jgi:hypothetical protein